MELGVDPNTPTADAAASGYTPLMAAASRDCPDIAEELLRTGCCDVARANAEGFTALRYLKLAALVGEKAGTVSIVYCAGCCNVVLQ